MKEPYSMMMAGSTGGGLVGKANREALPLSFCKSGLIPLWVGK